MASYRYRAAIPAKAIGPMRAAMNDFASQVMVFAKPAAQEIEQAQWARSELQSSIIVDYCDDHFGQDGFAHYDEFLPIADAVTCPTPAMAAVIRKRYAGSITVIPDPWEFHQIAPHCNGGNLLWFGHGSNWDSMARLLPKLMRRMRVVSNIPLAMPWSMDTMYTEFARADIVLMPATKDYKSPNRTIEAIRQGCFVVAEPHPSLEGFPIWQGDILEGIEWAIQNPQLANEQTRVAQEWIRKFSPAIVGAAWKTLCDKTRSQSISDREKPIGMAGSTSTDSIPVPM